MSFTSLEKAQKIMKVADDMKAIDISLLDIHQKTSVADYFIVCTGTSDIHTRSIADKVAEKLREEKIKSVRSETKSPSWILLDFGDVILHVMKEETRQFYDLETLWNAVETNPDLLTHED